MKLYHGGNGQVEKHKIAERTFDNVALAKYSIPTHWDIGKVYQRLILAVSAKQN